MSVSASITQLFIYPIKSCGGCAVSEARLAPGGLEGDRRYMLTDEGGKFITRRTEPRLCVVRASLHGAEFSVFAPNAPPLELPLFPRADDPFLGESLRSEIWRDEVEGREHSSGSAWFSNFLERRVRLVYLPEASLRQVNPDRSQPGDVVSLADGYPLLLCSESSLADLNSRLEHPVPMERFRPNVVVAGTSPFAEDDYATILLGEVPFDVPKGCDRCVVTTLEEGTGRASKEPLKTLATFRRWDGAVWFGVNLIPRSEGTLYVGQSLTLPARH